VAGRCPSRCSIDPTHGVTLEVNRENLKALAAHLESADLNVVIDKVYPLSHAADAVAHMLGHHSRGKVAIAA
jgi:NADPH:quinone reductase-like Zn-dependent oxidoreductase